MSTATAVLPRKAWVEQIMGLPVSVHVRGPRPEQAAGAVARLFADLRHADAVFSPYRDDSELSRLERGELALIDADHTLPEVLALCGEARRRTGGWFDARGLPDPRTGAPRLDPSGLVKGWAAERAARHLADLDDHGWCLNAGGDVLVESPDGHPAWRVGIEHPAAPGRILRAVEVRAGAVATSGDTHRGAHIVDPHTRRPATAVRSVTVRGPSLQWADVHATAAAARGSLTGLPAGYAGLLVARDGTVTTTPAWRD